MIRLLSSRHKRQSKKEDMIVATVGSHSCPVIGVLSTGFALPLLPFAEVWRQLAKVGVHAARPRGSDDDFLAEWRKNGSA